MEEIVITNTENWINDMTYKCNSCDAIFRAYFKEETTTHFCPSCASRDLEGYEEEEEEK